MRHVFAPGAIEHYKRRQRRALLVWLGITFVASCLGTAIVKWLPLVIHGIVGWLR